MRTEPLRDSTDHGCGDPFYDCGEPLQPTISTLFARREDVRSNACVPPGAFRFRCVFGELHFKISFAVVALLIPMALPASTGERRCDNMPILPRIAAIAIFIESNPCGAGVYVILPLAAQKGLGGYGISG